MSETSASPVPILYVTDLTYPAFDPADLFDLAYLTRSSRHRLVGVCLTDASGAGNRILDELAFYAETELACYQGEEGILRVLSAVADPVNVVVVGGYPALMTLLEDSRALVREKVARIFLVGGQANDYQTGRAGERLPIDPRLKERHPERFAPAGEPRTLSDRVAFAHVLTSGEGIIWLPRDICLWRYAAPDLLRDGGPLTEFLLRELFYAHLRDGGWEQDRYDAARRPVLLSALPAFLLALEPDPFAWMRLFRVIPARVETEEQGMVQQIVTRTEHPNLYAVIAIDGQALSKTMTTALRVRPQTG